MTEKVEFIDDYLEFCEIPRDLKQENITGQNQQTQIIFSNKEYENDSQDYTTQKVIVTIDEENNSITVNNYIRYYYNYRNIGNDNYNIDYTYRINDKRVFYSFEVLESKLEISKGEIVQNVREDTMGGGNWPVINFNSISDLQNHDLIKWLGKGAGYIPIEKSSYEVVNDYKVTDGIRNVIKSKRLTKK
ncbi:MAG: hypothetical protein HFJ12_06860 [Bacilli bacterium]|nr:hypothetical protein [Bacilli bacterium]